MKVVSGGQTGVDRAALDVALALSLPYGGFVPKGRLAEDGSIPARYCLEECDSTDYAVRTELNVVHSDATLILNRGRLERGTKLTHWLALKHKKPVEAVDFAGVESDEEASNQVFHFLERVQPQILNVAGPRESQCPGIHGATFGVLKRALEHYLSR